MLKQTDKEIKVNSGPIKGEPYLKVTSQKHNLLKNLKLKILNNNFLNKDSNRNLKLKSERGLRKEGLLNDKNSISVLSRAKSKVISTNRKKRNSFDNSFSNKEKNNEIKKSSSSLIKSSEIESSKNSNSNSNSLSSNSNTNSKEEEKSNKTEKDSEVKISYSNENNKENNENNSFSRIEEEESSDNSQNQESEEFMDNNLKWSKKFRTKIFE